MGMQSIVGTSAKLFGPDTAATQYAALHSNITTTWDSSEAERNVWPMAGTISNLRVQVATAPSSGKSLAFTIRQNGGDSVVVATIADTNTSAADTTHSFSVSAGDLINIKSVPSGTPTSPGATSWSCLFTASSTNQSVLIGGNSATIAANTTAYMEVIGESANNATETNRQQLIPTGGTLKNLYVATNVSPGVADSVTVTIMQNTVAGTLTAAVSNGTSANDTTHTVTVAAGDTISWKVVTSNVAFTACVVYISCEFDPTTDGESIGMVDSGSTVAQNVTTYRNSGSSAFNGTEVNSKVIFNACVLKKLYVKTSAPASGQTLVTTMRQNTADTIVTATVTGTGTTANDSSNTVTISNNDLVNFKAVTSATSGTLTPQFGIVYYIAPTSTFLAAPNRPGMQAINRSNTF